jgi:hypothetical protein
MASQPQSSSLKSGDVIALFLDDDDDREGATLGYLGSDPTGQLGTSVEETLLVVPMQRTETGIEYPSSFQNRCLFRMDMGGTKHAHGAAGQDILYGSMVTLMHMNTEMCIQQPNPNARARADVC